MEIATEILTQVREDSNRPATWLVFPLLRKKVAWGIVGWTFGIIIGLGLFALVTPIVVPFNYQRGPLAAITTTLLLAILLFVGLGSIWALVVDVRRLRQADKHLIVITPEDFVKQEGEKIIHVPLVYVRHVTARGIRPTDPDVSESHSSEGSTAVSSRRRGPRDVPGVGENLSGFVFGRGLVPSGQRWKRRRMRTPTSLAFIDTRTDTQVTVVADEAYGDPRT